MELNFQSPFLPRCNMRDFQGFFFIVKNDLGQRPYKGINFDAMFFLNPFDSQSGPLVINGVDFDFIESKVPDEHLQRYYGILW